MEVVAYYRFPTTGAGGSELELQAQRKAVSGHCDQRGWTVIAEFTEAEGSKHNARPGLLAALRRAKSDGAVLCIAKLDRLSRDARFLMTLGEGDTKVAFADVPEIEGPLEPIVLAQMAAVAALEAGLTSGRAKAARAAWARGTKPGDRIGAASSLRAPKPHRAPMEVRSEAAEQFARDRAQDIAEVRETGATSLREIAAGLNERGIPSPNGGPWHHTTVRRVLQRVEA